MENCPNCGAKLNAKSFFSPNVLGTQEQTDFINYFAENKKEAYCLQCGPKLHEAGKASLNLEILETKRKIREAINNIPCLNLQSPLGWDYEAICLVTAQSTMGTGFFNELSSGIDDFLGVESDAVNSKILKGEENCLNKLRSKCFKLGGNAIIGIDIDYSEMGGLKGMVMVCMTGTVIKVKNTSVFPSVESEGLEKIDEYQQKILTLNEMISSAN